MSESMTPEGADADEDRFYHRGAWVSFCDGPPMPPASDRDAKKPTTAETPKKPAATPKE